MRLKFVTIGQKVKWPRGRLSLARKKHRKKDSGFSSSNKGRFSQCISFVYPSAV